LGAPFGRAEPRGGADRQQPGSGDGCYKGTTVRKNVVGRFPATGAGPGFGIGLRQLLVLGSALLALAALLTPFARAATTLPPNFRETTVFSGLKLPTAIRFAADGTVFVAEKSGLIKTYAGLDDTTPTIFADLRSAVYNHSDRGLLGLAVDPSYPARPYVYVLYAFDVLPGGSAPHWNDTCPTPPGATRDGCVVMGRLSRLEKTSGASYATERVLIEDWCQQFPSHSVGDLVFGADGALYASSGDGASYNNADYGQSGGGAGSPTPKNPCGDPPGGAGAVLAPPSAEGGALRSQDLRSSSDPTGLSGTIIRIDPDTGAALPDNPLAGDADANTRRIVAYGLRNPFRMAVRPGSNDVWVGDVGWYEWEEINRVADPRSAALNFGWPCYEGASSMRAYASLGLDLCRALYASGSVTAPIYVYQHAKQVVSGEACATGDSSTSGLAFYSGGVLPQAYDGALFFADYARSCIWLMYRGADGLPDPANRAVLATDAAGPVDLEIGPDGQLYYVDLLGGTVRRIAYHAANQPPLASASADRYNGPAPLRVQFNGGASRDPENSPLTYAWDLDGDGAFDDSAAPNPAYTFAAPGTYRVRLRVADLEGASDTSEPLTILAGNTPPVASIASPSSATQWSVGNTVLFTGTGSDVQDGTLAAQQLGWEVVLYHCVTPTNCHAHPTERYDGIESGGFVAPDHEYPSYLELLLTATDSDGVRTTSSMRIAPRTVQLTLHTEPEGLQLSMGSSTEAAPLSRNVIVGSANTVVAPSPQRVGNTEYVFDSWSDGGEQAHFAVAAATSAHLTARYRAVSVRESEAPHASMVAARGIDASSAAIEWTTDEPAIGIVEYGTSPSLASRTAPSGALGTNHSVRLSGLQSNTAYYYRVVSTDADGNRAESQTAKFTTAKGAAAPAPAEPSIERRFIPFIARRR